eukprot:15336201-Ditylum_brightwellii.AAC.1
MIGISEVPVKQHKMLSSHQKELEIDDLHDSWGAFMAEEKQTTCESSEYKKTMHALEQLETLINEHCVPFKFVNTSSSGSQGVQWIINNLGDNNLHNILFGCGYYVTEESYATYQPLATSTTNQSLTGEITTSHASELAKTYHCPSIPHSMQHI